MIEYLKNLKANYTVSAIICTIIGLVLLIWPGTSTHIVCMVFGGILLGFGLIQIGIFLLGKKASLYQQGVLVLGIVFALCGIWIIIYPESIIVAIPIIMGIIIVLHGIHNAIQALELKKSGYSKWGVAFLLGLLTVALGALLIYNPFSVITTIVRVIGAFLIYDGLSDMWILSRLFKFRKGKTEKPEVVDGEAVILEEKD